MLNTALQNVVALPTTIARLTKVSCLVHAASCQHPYQQSGQMTCLWTGVSTFYVTITYKGRGLTSCLQLTRTAPAAAEKPGLGEACLSIQAPLPISPTRRSHLGPKRTGA